jgi:hypothetical protein
VSVDEAAMLSLVRVGQELQLEGCVAAVGRGGALRVRVTGYVVVPSVSLPVEGGSDGGGPTAAAAAHASRTAAITAWLSFQAAGAGGGRSSGGEPWPAVQPVVPSSGSEEEQELFLAAHRQHEADLALGEGRSEPDPRSR